MNGVFTPYNDEARFLPLLSLLVLGVLLYFPVSPGSYLADMPEVSLPLGIVGGLCGFAYLLRVQYAGTHFDKRSGYFGWLGVAAGGAAAIWLTVQYLPMGFSVSRVYSDGLTVLSLSAAVGSVIGFLTTGVHQRASTHRVDRNSVVAESTWTNQSGSTPILAEIVEQLSDLEGAEPVEIEPLGNHFNVTIFEDLRADTGSPWQVLFYASDYEIRVSSHGTITVYDIRAMATETIDSIDTIH